MSQAKSFGAQWPLPAVIFLAARVSGAMTDCHGLSEEETKMLLELELDGS